MYRNFRWTLPHIHQVLYSLSAIGFRANGFGRNHRAALCVADSGGGHSPDPSDCCYSGMCQGEREKICGLQTGDTGAGAEGGAGKCIFQPGICEDRRYGYTGEKFGTDQRRKYLYLAGEKRKKPIKRSEQIALWAFYYCITVLFRFSSSAPLHFPESLRRWHF